MRLYYALMCMLQMTSCLLYKRTLPWPRRTLISSGKGFGGKSGVQTKSKEAEMIDDIRATLIERPREEALHFNLGLLLLSSSPGRPPDDGVKREALMAFQNSVMLNPKRTGAWYNLAVLSDEFGEVDKAVEAYEKVLSLTSTTGKWKDNEDEGDPLRVACHSNKISLLIHQGKLDEAAKASDAAVKEYPDDASLWCGMGVVLRMDSNVEWATKAFETALSCCKEEGKQNSRQGQEESLLVALNNLGALYASTVTAAETVTQAAEAANKAVRMYERALELQPADLSSLYGLGVLKRDLGMLVEARVCFEKAAAVAPDDSQVPYQLAMLDRAEGRDSGVDTAPRAYVSSLFDYYASNDYDAHLLSLEYRGPQLLWEAFDRQQQQQPPRVGCLADLKVLEIGCGSGLVGRYFRERGCGYSFEGCDLSPVMVRTAKDAIFTKPPGDDPTNIDMVYSKVVEGDAATFLSTHSAGAHNNNEGDRGADLVLAGDVLCYIGRLDELFASVGSSLRDGGLFIFTVEAGTEKARGVGDAWKSAGFTLRSTGRFAHSQAYIEALAEAHGMKVERMHAEMLRRDGTEPIHGFVCTLERQKN